MRIKTCLLCALHTFLNGASHSLKKNAATSTRIILFFFSWKPQTSIYLASVLFRVWKWNHSAFPVMISQWKIQTLITWWYLIWFLHFGAALLKEETSPLRGGGRLLIYQSVLPCIPWPILLLKIALLRSLLQIEFCCFIAHCSLTELPAHTALRRLTHLLPSASGPSGKVRN